MTRAIGGAHPAEELRRAVEAATTGTPYVVTPTERGFDVSLDIVDAQWFGLFSKAGLAKQYTHHVAVPGDGTYTVAGVADQLGLELRRGAAEKVGIAFALLAVGGLLVAGVVVGILALLGRL